MYPLNRDKLKEWAGPDAFRRAELLVDAGRVYGLKSLPRRIEGLIESRPRDIRCAVTFPRDSPLPENQCPCRDNREGGVFCHHAVALCLEQLSLQEDPVRLERLMEERRRAERIARGGERDYLQRVPAGTPGATAIRLCLEFPAALATYWWREQIPLRVLAAQGGSRIPLCELHPNLRVTLTAEEDNLLYVLEDIAEGPIPEELLLSRRDLANVLELMPGMRFWMGEREGRVAPGELQTALRLDLDEDSGELNLDLEIRLPDGLEQAVPAYWAEGRGAWMLAGDRLFRLRPVLPPPLQSLYREAVRVPRAEVPRFIRRELPALRTLTELHGGLSESWFSFEPDRPEFRLEVRGSPASLSAVLFARYDGVEWVAGAEETPEDYVVPDPANILHYRTRNPAAERAALDSLRTLGFGGDRGDRMQGLVGTSAVLGFCASGIPLLRRRGWKVDLTGSIAGTIDEADSLMPVVRVREGAGDWFELEYTFETGEGESLRLAEVRQALSAGNSFVQRNGRTWLFDREATCQLLELLEDCGGGSGGELRLPKVYGGYLKSTLDALDGVDVEASPAWLERMERQNQPARLEPVAVSPALRANLRPYQQEGVNWLYFLERSGFGGILADEMGLGKTLQTLAWLQLARVDPAAAKLPALIVCPTSLVENWIEEGERFTPDLVFLNLTGSPERRDRLWETQRQQAAVWVTSYAVLQRDLARYLREPVSALVLDEAQHIKNRDTRNARAVKKIQAHSRLVLTGTPVENSVTDLWSIMDFLMPGYLGTDSQFRQKFEAPIRAGGEEAADAQARLRKKLRPFLLRRLKWEVARDLPPKIEKIAYCRMTADQMLVYRELVRNSATHLENLVAQQGFARSRMEVLKTLLRLRQVCCHLDLLKLPGVQSQAPSGKLELFREMIDEAMDGGHRVLVFSQFTSMLAILRRELEAMGLGYCYLDGSTRNRMDEVRRFQRDDAVPVFLISLKAGGTGLNLTGADMVIHFDPWWNPAVEHQATDRAYRIGQQRSVYSLKLITRDSVEEKVLALQHRKQQVIDATLDPDTQLPQALDWEDVQELLRI